jgi:hypothetical protein
VNEAALCMELPITLIFWGFLFRILLDMPDITSTLTSNHSISHHSEREPSCRAHHMPHPRLSFQYFSVPSLSFPSRGYLRCSVHDPQHDLLPHSSGDLQAN